MPDNFETLFGTPPPHPVDAEAQLQGLLFFAEGRDVETCIYRTTLDFTSDAPLSMEKANLGPSITSLEGNRVWFRVDSFKDNGRLDERAFSPMVAGEIRDFLVVVEARDPAGGVELGVTLIKYMRMSFESNYNTGSLPKVKDTVTYAAHNSTVLPLAYCDRHESSRKRREKTGDVYTNQHYPLAFFASLDVYAKASSGPTLSIRHNFTTFKMAEWVCEVSSPSQYEAISPFLQRMNQEKFDYNHSKFVSKIVTHVQRSKDRHPVDEEDLYPQNVSTPETAFKVACLYSSLTTASAIVDLLASGTFSGLSLPIFENPLNFPLYVSICVTLAAKSILPTQIGSPDDAYCATQVFESFSSIAYGKSCLEESERGKSALERLVRIAVENLELEARHNASNFVLDGQTKSLSTVAEMLRRQGVALCNEIVSPENEEIQAFYTKRTGEMFPESVRRDARESLLPDCVRRACKAARASGVRGDATAGKKRVLRSASRDAAMRTIVSIIWEFNDFLCTGVYHRRRIYNDLNWKEGVNTQAWYEAMQIASGYLRLGAIEMTKFAAMLVFPVRPRTRMTCANCAAKFQPVSIATHLCGSACGACGGYYCTRCYAWFVGQVKKRTKKLVVTTNDLIETPDIWHCASCKRSKSSKTKSAK